MSRETTKVLLVEEHPEHGRILREHLTGGGAGEFELFEADGLPAALERLDAGGIDAVLLGSGLSDGGGPDAVERVRDRARSIPIVVLVEASDQRPASDWLRKGAQDVLVRTEVGASLLARSIWFAVERKRAQEALQAASRLEVTATLASGIAHQFNNLLCSVVGNAELVKSHVATQPALLAKLTRVISAAKGASELAQQLHTFTKASEPKDLNLNDTVERSLLLGVGRAGGPIQIEQDLEPSLWPIHADPVEMAHIILNLWRNATEAIEGAGRIRITTRNVPVDEHGAHLLGGLAPGRYVCLSVEDTGSGMDAETRARLFEAFFTTKVDGRGIGLSAADDIVRSCGGGVVVESQVGGGTKLEVYLPAVKDAAPEAEDATSSLASGEARTILVIDDEEMILRLARRLLEGLGHKVLTAQTGTEAIDFAERRAQPIDVALLDINLPSDDTTRLYARLAATRPEMKVIVCSGDSGTSARPLLHAGAVAFLSKPFRLDALEREIRRAL